MTSKYLRLITYKGEEGRGIYLVHSIGGSSSKSSNPIFFFKFLVIVGNISGRAFVEDHRKIQEADRAVVTKPSLYNQSKLAGLEVRWSDQMPMSRIRVPGLETWLHCWASCLLMCTLEEGRWYLKLSVPSTQAKDLDWIFSFWLAQHWPLCTWREPVEEFKPQNVFFKKESAL